MNFFILASTPAPFDFSQIFRNFESRWYFYLTLLVVLIAIIGSFFIKKQNVRNHLTKTQKLVYTAMLSALCFVANLLTIKITDDLQISLVATVGFISGYLLGAGCGFTCAFVGDLLCGIVSPLGAYNPIIGIGTAMFGFVPGIVFNYFRGNKYVKVVVSYVLTTLITSFGINVLGFNLMFSMPLEGLLWAFPWKLLTQALNAGISIGVILLLPKILPKTKFVLNEVEKVIPLQKDNFVSEESAVEINSEE